MTNRLIFLAVLSISSMAAQKVATTVPRAWDSQALSDWATPLAHDGIRQKFFSEEEYYASPVDNYRTYPVYNPDREPPGYWESLKRKKPEPIIDTGHIGPSFDWVATGKILWTGCSCIPRVQRRFACTRPFSKVRS